jgi:hypothetical protein
MRIGHSDDARADARDLPRHVPELEDVTGEAFDREILVQRSDERVFRLEQHAIVGDFRDRASGGEREQPRGSPGAQRGMYFVAMDQRRATSSSRRKTLETIDTTASKCLRSSSRYGDARRTSWYNSSSPYSRQAVSAVICCARTSSGASW